MSNINSMEGWDDDDEPSNLTLEEKVEILRQIQDEQPTSKQRLAGTKSNSSERDFFIPVFATISLLGLFGSYAYEMARLASRGELYLPWK